MAHPFHVGIGIHIDLDSSFYLQFGKLQPAYGRYELQIVGKSDLVLTTICERMRGMKHRYTLYVYKQGSLLNHQFERA